MGRAMRVLLVEDDAFIVGMLSMFLAEEGHASAAARDYPAALTCLADGPWDAIISDSLPPADAPLEPEELARFGELARHAPLIILSGKPWAACGQAPEVPAVAVLPKPFNLDELIAAIEVAQARRN